MDWQRHFAAWVAAAILLAAMIVGTLVVVFMLCAPTEYRVAFGLICVVGVAIFIGYASTTTDSQTEPKP